MQPQSPELEQMIEMFLQINPEPSDEQFHNLAHALGVDKETLEAVAYQMLGEDIETQGPTLATSTHFETGDGGEYGEGRELHEGQELEAYAVKAATRLKIRATEEVVHHGGGTGEEGLSEQQEVIQGEGDLSTTNTDNLALTDGAPEGQSTDDEMQDSMLVDGEGPDDIGIGMESDKSMLLNDGAPALQLTNASKRIQASEGMRVHKSAKEVADSFCNKGWTHVGNEGTALICTDGTTKVKIVPNGSDSCTLYEVKASMKIKANSTSYVLKQICDKLKAGGLNYEMADSNTILVEGATSKILTVLKSAGLHYKGPYRNGMHLFMYNKTSKDMGFVDYEPRSKSIRIE